MPQPSDGQLRVLVIDDDPDALLLMNLTLGQRGGMKVRTAADPVHALGLLDSEPVDVVVTDVVLPEMSGLQLLNEIRVRQPNLPVVVVTAHASVEFAVEALRNRADEFLRKPLNPTELLDVVRRLGEQSRRRAGANRQVVLAVGAHPDDVEIGVGGLLIGHRDRGDEIAIITLTRGARGALGDGAAVRERESRAAAELLKATLFLEDLHDTQVPVSDPTVSAIQRAISEAKPDIIYTHSVHDLHQDHRAVYQASMVAARGVSTIACYQSPSATVEFQPNRFIDIDNFVRAKLELLACFASQINSREYLEPDVIEATARYWSRFGSGRHIEPLEVVRERSGPIALEPAPDAAVEATNASG